MLINKFFFNFIKIKILLMTINAVLELKKIKKLIRSERISKNDTNFLFIFERNNFNENNKIYNYKRFSEFLRYINECGLSTAFSELIFLELFSHRQTFFNFNLLLKQTMELLLTSMSLSGISRVLMKFFIITNWNLINFEILLKFTSFYDSFAESKGFIFNKESKERKSFGNNNKEFSITKIEKIRVLIDEKDFLKAGILSNSLFRLKFWKFFKNEEKKILAEQISRILLKSQNLNVLAIFYYIILEYSYFINKNNEFAKIYTVLSSVYFYLGNNSNCSNNLKKLIEIKYHDLFGIRCFELFGYKKNRIFRIIDQIQKTSKIPENFLLLFKGKCLDKIRKSIKAKSILDSLRDFSIIYKSLKIKNLKKEIKVDLRDLEYYLMFFFQQESIRTSFDSLRGILYFNLN